MGFAENSVMTVLEHDGTYYNNSVSRVVIYFIKWMGDGDTASPTPRHPFLGLYVCFCMGSGVSTLIAWSPLTVPFLHCLCILCQLRQQAALLEHHGDRKL